VQEVRLQYRGGQYTQHAAGEEGVEHQARGELAGVAPFERPHHEGHRYQEAAEKYQGRNQVGVTGNQRDQHRGEPQREADQEHP
jgi:hypothetical protein